MIMLVSGVSKKERGKAGGKEEGKEGERAP
jgi:hypothetical protein